ncbi:hypothetical protein H6F44_00990 [Pseudanabaena sp. FACHB-1277]|uniref:Gcp-like domain-containing protein n=1 Tax=Pseudanabaena cinerea FACHB-1277 TaxID=2949581 RepID=A0A926UPK0_9CYAN|nr:hypothetical protein [Pseudanabaena cinerea]MBD2148709.1 hypothetical protein [Pseudanabaena cinerea FACHB-1277]
MNKSFALALHTTTSKLDLTIAAIKYDADRCPYAYNIHKQQSWELGRDLSVRLHDCLSVFVGDLSWQDFKFVAIATGIGSFTGMRIGVVVARTLGEQLDIPVYGIDCDTIEARSHQELPPLDRSSSLIAIAYEQWRSQSSTQDFSNWRNVLPIYETD